MKTVFSLVICLVLLSLHLANGQADMVSIKGGTYTPLYGRDSLQVTIGDFKMDVYPVTNQQYLAFVKTHPKWQRSNVKKLFADANYLSNWKSDTALGTQQSMHAPITNISWFAANDYCTSQGKRLPSVDEWEYVAMANETMPDARQLESYNTFILSWYEKPKTSNNEIGSTFKKLLECIRFTWLGLGMDFRF